MASGYLFAILSMLANVASQQMWSHVMKEAGDRYRSDVRWIKVGVELLQDGRMWCGGFFAVVCICFWALALSQLPIAKALPIMALAFVFSPLVAAFVFGEAVRPLNVIGFLMVSIGVVLAVSR